MDLRGLHKPPGFSPEAMSSHCQTCSPAGSAGQKQDLIQHWTTGISRAQKSLKLLRKQHERPSAEEVATAVSKAQETGAALETCASMHELGFAFDFVQSEMLSLIHI